MSQSVTLGEDIHLNCFCCGKQHDDGLGLDFHLQDDGSVIADYRCPSDRAGYPARLHGGIVAALLDSSMTNCLYAHGVTAATVELTVRYHDGTDLEQPATVQAWLDESRPPVYRLHAELVQGGRVRAKAKARFMPIPESERAAGAR